jgi:ribonuclease HI
MKDNESMAIDTNTVSEQTIEIYTDGACRSNPGPGGWGAVILYPNRTPLEISGGEKSTTNNQMELNAVINALESIEKTNDTIVLYTDSKYVKEGITNWLDKWKQNNWKTSLNTPVKNQSLWQKLNSCTQTRNIEWKWVKGHAGNQWNELADELARLAVPKIDTHIEKKSEKLPIDDSDAIHIFTAIAFSSKNKSGAWAAYLRYKEHTKSISEKVENTSSNQIHIYSAIGGLKLIKKKYPIHLYTLSDYLKDGASIWIRNWHKNNWTTKEGHPVKHKELWMSLHQLIQPYQIKWHRAQKKSLPRELKMIKDMANKCLQ